MKEYDELFNSVVSKLSWESFKVLIQLVKLREKFCYLFCSDSFKIVCSFLSLHEIINLDTSLTNHIIRCQWISNAFPKLRLHFLEKSSVRVLETSYWIQLRNAHVIEFKYQTNDIKELGALCQLLPLTYFYLTHIHLQCISGNVTNVLCQLLGKYSKYLKSLTLCGLVDFYHSDTSQYIGTITSLHFLVDLPLKELYIRNMFLSNKDLTDVVKKSRYLESLFIHGSYFDSIHMQNWISESLKYLDINDCSYLTEKQCENIVHDGFSYTDVNIKIYWRCLRYNL